MQVVLHIGRTELDNYSINIEFVGYGAGELTIKQLASGRELLEELKNVYTWIDDNEVMPHLQVAYGVPYRKKSKKTGRWYGQSRNHRGRKRDCGLMFADNDVRRELGLNSKPKQDPDVSAGRLVVPNDYYAIRNARALYGNGVVSASETALASSAESEEEENGNGAVLHTIQHGQGVWAYAGDEYAAATTTYIVNYPPLK